MELLEFQVWKNKFYELRETLANIEGMTNDNTLSYENEIRKVWNSLPNNVKSMKALGIAFLTMNYIIPDTRNRLVNDLNAACVALNLTKYKPRIAKLSASM